MRIFLLVSIKGFTRFGICTKFRLNKQESLNFNKTQVNMNTRTQEDTQLYACTFYFLLCLSLFQLLMQKIQQSHQLEKYIIFISKLRSLALQRNQRTTKQENTKASQYFQLIYFFLPNSSKRIFSNLSGIGDKFNTPLSLIKL